MTIQNIDLQRVTELPSTVAANTFYAVKVAGEDDANLYLTNNSGTIRAELLGRIGPPGPPAKDGQSHTYHALGPPLAGLGIDGETYFDDTNGDSYAKIGGVWEFKYSQRGDDSVGLDPAAFGISTQPSDANDTLLRNFIIDAAQNGSIIDFKGREYLLNSPLSGANSLNVAGGVYRWRRGTIKELGSNSEGIYIRGPEMPVVTYFTSPVSSGDFTVTVNDASGFSNDQRLCLVSSEKLREVSGTDNSNVSEYVSVKAISGNVITLSSSVKFSFPASQTSLILDATPTSFIDFVDMRFIRDPAITNCIGVTIVNAQINKFDCYFDDCYTAGVQFDRCSNLDPIKITGGKISFGYGAGVYACDHLTFSDVRCEEARHGVSMSYAGDAFTHGGETYRLSGNGGGGNSCHVENCSNSVIDSHPGHIGGGHWGRVTGAVNADLSSYPNGEVGQLSDGVTIESNGGAWSFGQIDVYGSHNPVSFQFYGAPEGSPNTSLNIGSISGSGLSTGSSALDVLNKDDINYGTVSINIGMIVGDFGGLISCKSRQNADKGGDIRGTIGVLSGSCSNGFGIYLEAGGNSYNDKGRVFLSVLSAGFEVNSGNGNYMCVAAYGGDYSSHNPDASGGFTKPGVLLDFSGGTITRTVTNDSVGIRAYDSVVTLGAGVEVTVDPGNVALSTGGTLAGAINRVQVSAA